MTRHVRHSTDPVRITTAPRSLAEDIAMRQRRYLWSMAVRTACVIGAVLVGPGWFRWVLIAGALFLPYVAVVMANATNQKVDDYTLGPFGDERAELPGPEREHGDSS